MPKDTSLKIKCYYLDPLLSRELIAILRNKLNQVKKSIERKGNEDESLKAQESELQQQLKKLKKKSTEYTLNLEKSLNSSISVSLREPSLLDSKGEKPSEYDIVFFEAHGNYSTPKGKGNLARRDYFIGNGVNNTTIKGTTILDKVITQTKKGGIVAWSSCHAAIVPDITEELQKKIEDQNIDFIIFGGSKHATLIGDNGGINAKLKITEDSSERPENILEEYWADTYQFYDKKTKRFEKRSAIKLSKSEGGSLSFYRQKSYYDRNEGKWIKYGIEIVPTERLKNLDNGLLSHMLTFPKIKNYNEKRTTDFLNAIKTLYKEREKDNLPKLKTLPEAAYELNIFNYAIRHSNDLGPVNYNLSLAKGLIGLFDKAVLKDALNSSTRDILQTLVSMNDLIKPEIGRYSEYRSITEKLEEKLDCEHWFDIIEKKKRKEIITKVIASSYSIEFMYYLISNGFLKDFELPEIEAAILVHRMSRLRSKNNSTNKMYKKKIDLLDLYRITRLEKEEKEKIIKKIDPIEEHPIIVAANTFDKVPNFITLIHSMLNDIPGNDLSSIISAEDRSSIANELLKKGRKKALSYLIKHKGLFNDTPQLKAGYSVLAHKSPKKSSNTYNQTEALDDLFTKVRGEGSILTDKRFVVEDFLLILRDRIDKEREVTFTDGFNTQNPEDRFSTLKGAIDTEYRSFLYHAKLLDNLKIKFSSDFKSKIGAIPYPPKKRSAFSTIKGLLASKSVFENKMTDIFQDLSEDSELDEDIRSVIRDEQYWNTFCEYVKATLKKDADLKKKIVHLDKKSVLDVVKTILEDNVDSYRKSQYKEIAGNFIRRCQYKGKNRPITPQPTCSNKKRSPRRPGQKY